jgi:hypothetical protein
VIEDSEAEDTESNNTLDAEVEQPSIEELSNRRTLPEHGIRTMNVDQTKVNLGEVSKSSPPSNGLNDSDESEADHIATAVTG